MPDKNPLIRSPSMTPTTQEFLSSGSTLTLLRIFVPYICYFLPALSRQQLGDRPMIASPALNAGGMSDEDRKKCRVTV
jgi:hypothetical protein